MKKLSYLIALMLTIGIVACSEKKEAAKDELSLLKEEVIDIHDEVMPRMDAIFSYRSKAENKLEAEGLTEEEAEQLRALIRQLDEADDAMMGWMRGFKMYESDLGDITEEEVFAYYIGEKAKITEVKFQMLKALEDAAGLLD